MFAPRVVEKRQVELAHVFAVSLVAGVRELLSAGIYVQAVGQPLSMRVHVTAGAVGGLEHDDIWPRRISS